MTESEIYVKKPKIAITAYLTFQLLKLKNFGQLVSIEI